MKLWYSTTSPFVRKVMAVLKYHKLDEQIELLRVHPRSIPIRHITKTTRSDAFRRYSLITENGCLVVY